MFNTFLLEYSAVTVVYVQKLSNSHEIAAVFAETLTLLAPNKEILGIKIIIFANCIQVKH